MYLHQIAANLTQKANTHWLIIYECPGPSILVDHTPENNGAIGLNTLILKQRPDHWVIGNVEFSSYRALTLPLANQIRICPHASGQAKRVQ